MIIQGGTVPDPSCLSTSITTRLCCVVANHIGQVGPLVVKFNSWRSHLPAVVYSVPPYIPTLKTKPLATAGTFYRKETMEVRK
jgi:hypothetical protein